MKNGTFYAIQLKKAFAKHRRSVSNPEIPEPDDPLRRLAVGILGVSSGDGDAERAIDRILDAMADWNEVRVSTTSEVQQTFGKTIPDAFRRCQELITALQAVFDRENRLSLDRLRHLGRREARQYLEGLKGVDEYAAASVILWSLGGHAIPVHDKLLEALRKADLVNPTATRAEVQAFLERHIIAAEAKQFCVVMNSLKWTKSTAKRSRTTASSKRPKGTIKRAAG